MRIFLNAPVFLLLLFSALWAAPYQPKHRSAVRLGPFAPKLEHRLAAATTVVQTGVDQTPALA